MSEGVFGMGLFEQHAECLRARGVSTDVARERGYRSAHTARQGAVA
jgi:hypothetical protein